MPGTQQASAPCGEMTAGGATIWAATVILFATAGLAAAQSVAPPGAAACSGCHGAGSAGIVPSLRGRAPEEIVAAMQGFRTGQLPATVMDRIAKGFTDEETRAIASWVSGQR